jgi:hypothetical protein
MSQSDLIEAEIRRLGIKKEEDQTQIILASLTESIAKIETSLKKKIEDLEEVIKHQGLIIDELQKRFKKPIRIEINKEERERILAIEEKLNRVEYSANFRSGLNQHSYTPPAAITWKTSTEIHISDTNETSPVHPIETPVVTLGAKPVVKKVAIKTLGM